MKRILNVVLALVLLATAIPVAYASNVDAKEGTWIELVGKYTEPTYTVTVPARLSPGETGQVVVEGAWTPNQTITVTCPDKVELTYKDQSLFVGISFNGISQSGSYEEVFEISEDITIAEKEVAFGVWTGVVEYTVEIETAPNILSFTIDGEEYIFEENMTWGEWLDSEYNDGQFSRVGSHETAIILKNEVRPVRSDIYQTDASVSIYEDGNYYSILEDLGNGDVGEM